MRRFEIVFKNGMTTTVVGKDMDMCVDFNKDMQKPEYRLGGYPVIFRALCEDVLYIKNAELLDDIVPIAGPISATSASEALQF